MYGNFSMKLLNRIERSPENNNYQIKSKNITFKYRYNSNNKFMNFMKFLNK